MKPGYVQYGCGWCAPAGWRNFDASPTLVFERIPVIGSFYARNGARFPRNVEFGDIVKGLPVADDSSRAVYCSHVLEHLALEDFRLALRNTYRILRIGGCFRLVVPDLAQAVDRYVADNSASAAVVLVKDTCLGLERRRRGINGLLFTWLSNHKHLWMWDYKSIAKELQDAGFVGIRRAEFGDASDETFRQVEDLQRWEGSVGVDCRK
jgi:SAM-dependent methyltransferase